MSAAASSAGSHGHQVSQHWHVDIILLSYIIAVTGSYCTIQLMEQWRLTESGRNKIVMLILSSVALGGCGIWCMHFTGMNALKMVLDDQSQLEVDFEGGLTIISLIFPIVGVFIGLKVSSTDPFFLEVEAARRKDMLQPDALSQTQNLHKVSMQTIVKRDAISRKIKFIALFSRLWRIAIGGFFAALGLVAALGVLGMHYLGMLAQRTNAEMHFHFGIVALSCAIAFFTANAAFWILFRALTFWPSYESLRLVSALIMGVAVCGTHYVGMGAATYTYSEENTTKKTKFLFEGQIAAKVASHGSLLLCYWMSTFAVVRNLRRSAMSSKTSTVAPSNGTRGPSQAPRVQTTLISSPPSIRENNNDSQGPKRSTLTIEGEMPINHTHVVGNAISQHWSAEVILLSYVISVTGSYCSKYCRLARGDTPADLHCGFDIQAIMLMELWRMTESKRWKEVLLGLHYVGMGAASYTYSEETYSSHTTLLFEGTQASQVAPHGALLLCYWMSAFCVVKSLRIEVMVSNHSKPSTVHPSTVASRHGANASKATVSPNHLREVSSFVSEYAHDRNTTGPMRISLANSKPAMALENLVLSEQAYVELLRKLIGVAENVQNAPSLGLVPQENVVSDFVLQELD
ncbi:TPA: hypothetical protein N0F65_010452, partial [Lagenidium giganteum]